MALVNVDVALRELQRHLRKCSLGGGMEIMSYKRNRTVAVIKKTPDTFLILEKGYELRDLIVNESDLGKKMKPILKKEFPRSRKLRLFKFTQSSELERLHQKI